MPSSASAGGFFDPDRRNGSRGRSPSKCFFRMPQIETGGMPASASAGVSSIQISETAREAARPPGVFSGFRKLKLEGCRPRHPRGFLRSSSEKRLARPLALQVYFSGCRKVQLERCRPRHPRGDSSIQIGETAREAARPPSVFSGCRKLKLEGCRPRHPRGFLRSRSVKRLARPLALQVFSMPFKSAAYRSRRPIKEASATTATDLLKAFIPPFSLPSLYERPRSTNRVRRRLQSGTRAKAGGCLW